MLTFAAVVMIVAVLMTKYFIFSILPVLRSFRKGLSSTRKHLKYSPS